MFFGTSVLLKDVRKLIEMGMRPNLSQCGLKSVY